MTYTFSPNTSAAGPLIETVDSSDDGSAESDSISVPSPTPNVYSYTPPSKPSIRLPSAYMPESDESVCCSLRRHTENEYTVMFPSASV